ncbi:MAG TPA: ABC-type transport auxiliary lipoprotein family protein [Burkholderiaceae bacterium]|nr:ABC-type transport auxiliary lipoprotein family protein [Burkholderiaceae bacterium]
MKLLVKLAPAALAALLAACAASSPAPVLLTLPPVALPVPTAASSGTPAAAPLLAVRRVNIPEYLVARRVRYRADAATLAEWPNTYWAERIEIGVSREFVAALRAQLPGWSICDTNCGDQVPTLTLQVSLLPMDYLRSGQMLHAHARIALSGAGVPAKLLDTQALSVDIASNADTAQGHAQAITTLIEQVAAAAAPMVRGAKP